MQTPERIVSPNTLIIDGENLQLILKKTDLCFSSNNTLASEETLQEYTEINNNHDNNTSIKSIPGAMDLYREIISLDSTDFDEKITALTYQKNLFNKFIKLYRVYVDHTSFNSLFIHSQPIDDVRYWQLSSLVYIQFVPSYISSSLNFK